MLEVAIMIEGQNGLTWPRWQKIAKKVEELGFAGLFRSDHYTNANPPDMDSLELWVSLTWLASHTDRIAFGSIVSPFSFRHPTMTARMAAAVDDLSGGRLILGLGAGWQHREHTNYGWDLLDISSRMDRMKEGVQVVTRLLHSDTPINFDGKYYHLNDAILLPRPQRPGGPDILIGGNGEKRTLSMAARYADEWNCVSLKPERLRDLNRKLDALVVQEGRQPQDVRRSMMTGLVFGRDEAEVRSNLSLYNANSVEALRDRGMVVGTPNEVIDQLNRLQEAGLYRVLLQWMDLDNLDGLERLAAVLH